MTTQEPQLTCAGQTVSPEYRKWVKSRMPQMAALLDKADAGETPNFQDVLMAISNIVAFTTEGDSLESVESMRFSEMSGKFCRFCS